MWFQAFRRIRAIDQEAAMCRACALRGCPRRLAAERVDTGDRRGLRAHAARQYALVDTLHCPCLRPFGRGFLV